MNRATLHLLIALLATSTVACQSVKKYVPSDPAKLGMIPKEAHVVAETSTSSPMLFVPDQDGTVYFFADDDLLATVGVAKGQRIEFDALQTGSAETLSIDGKVVFKTGASRADYFRLFFVPAATPAMVRSDVLQ
jgi:hypothetical protein